MYRLSGCFTEVGKRHANRPLAEGAQRPVFSGLNISPAKHWSLGACGQGPVGMPFSHLSETSGEAIHLKGDRSRSAQRSKEKRDETFFQICVGMVGCGFCIGSPTG